MNWLDLFIIVIAIAAVVRGTEVGFVRQFLSTFGFFAGLFLGAWLQARLLPMANTPDTRALVAFIVTIGLGLAFMALGEYAGLMAKFHLREARLTNTLDKILGPFLAVITLLAAVWLGASIFRNIPDSGWQRQIRNSRIVTLLDSNLPSAPELITRIGHLIDPNNFPQVFSGLEPSLETDAPLPEMGELNTAVQAVRPSIVKVEGEGCSNVVEGSGFVASDGVVVTNAHVVAGVRHPYVIDQNGRHGATVVLFDPELDIALLRAEDLAGKPLRIRNTNVAKNTPVAVLGYPTDAGFTARPGVVLETFVARGRNIYNQGHTTREVYSVKTIVGQGDSGGPLLNKKGEVVGIVFAKSINYSQVGYALTMAQVVNILRQAVGQTEEVSTSSCAE